MAAIVATMLCVPAGALLAALLLPFGISPSVIVTFGGALHPVLGLVAWWAICFIPAVTYAAFVLPWSPQDS
jgi:hypothetical protein